MNKKNKKEQTELSYYGLYLLGYLKENRFEHASDKNFVKERAEEAAAVYERARLDGYPADGAQELAMASLMAGLTYSKYNILYEVMESEFLDEVPDAKREAFTEKLLPLVDDVFAIYDLCDEMFALSLDYDLLHTELTGAVSLYIAEYGV